MTVNLFAILLRTVGFDIGVSTEASALIQDDFDLSRECPFTCPTLCKSRLKNDSTLSSLRRHMRFS